MVCTLILSFCFSAVFYEIRLMMRKLQTNNRSQQDPLTRTANSDLCISVLLDFKFNDIIRILLQLQSSYSNTHTPHILQIWQEPKILRCFSLQKQNLPGDLIYGLGHHRSEVTVATLLNLSVKREHKESFHMQLLLPIC